MTTAPDEIQSLRVTPAKPNARNRRLDIQGLRAVAVLMVVAFHAGLPVPGGFVGVDVFFVISGFVITAMLMREWESTGRIRLGRFYVRRFKRLTPALAVTVGVVIVASFLLLSPFGSQQTAAKTGLGAMLLVANVVIARTTGDYFDAPAESNPLLNMWSLSVEEQFYLAFPAILLFGWLWGNKSRRPGMAPTLIVGLAGAMSFLLAMVGSVGVELPLMPETLVGFYGPATRAWEFAVGALLALGSGWLPVTSRRRALPLAMVGAVALAASMWLISDATPFPGAWTLLPVAGTTFLLAAGPMDNIITRALASRPLIAVGDRSYSIYLWHWPFIVFAQLLWPGVPGVAMVAAVLSLLPAYASYRWVEEPIRALPYTGRVPLLRLVAITIGPVLALSGILAIAATAGYWSTTVNSVRADVQPLHAGTVAKCGSMVPDAGGKTSECRWNEQATGTPVYLVGDSNAGHFSEGVVDAATALGRPVVEISSGSCPFLDVAYRRSDLSVNHAENCNTHVAQSFELLKEARPGLVLIANADYYFREDVALIGPAQGTMSNDPQQKLLALESGLTTTVGSLLAAGHEVTLVQTIPNWDEPDQLALDSCSLINIFRTKCNQEMRISDVLSRQGPVRDVYRSVSQAANVPLLDPWVTLCDDETCSVRTEGFMRYRDYRHITVAQSHAMSEAFAKAMSPS